MITAYVHAWDPILVEIGGPLAIRWYGLAYLVSFVLGFFLLKYLAKKKLWVLPEKEVSDFIAMAAMFGVFLGGRLGYVLFYMIPDQGLQHVMNDPLSVIRVWDGGMASHGGILALVIFTFIYSRKKKVSWAGLGDGLCVVAPVGLLSVRIANFVNGELHGRISESFKWAVKFPNTLFDPGAPEYENYHAALLSVQEHVPIPEGTRMTPDYVKEAIRSSPELQASMESFLFPRHPSQLYEAFLEGLLLFGILWALRLLRPNLGSGILTGLFFVIYAVGRIIAEQFREPDSAMIGLLTKGQFYSTFMIVMGVCFIIWGLTKGQKKLA